MSNFTGEAARRRPRYTLADSAMYARSKTETPTLFAARRFVTSILRYFSASPHTHGRAGSTNDSRGDTSSSEVLAGRRLADEILNCFAGETNRLIGDGPASSGHFDRNSISRSLSVAFNARASV